MRVATETVLGEIRLERAHQREKYDESHDDGHEIIELVQQAELALEQFPGGCVNVPLWGWEFLRKRLADGDQRLLLIQAAALLVAAIERMDREAAKR